MGRALRIIGLIVSVMFCVDARAIPPSYPQTEHRFAPEMLNPPIQQRSSPRRSIRRLPSVSPTPATSLSQSRFESTITNELSSLRSVPAIAAANRESREVPPSETPTQIVQTPARELENTAGQKANDWIVAEDIGETLADFSPNPLFQNNSSDLEINHEVYASKHPVPTQHPWVELGQTFYGTGITPEGTNLFGPYHPLRGEGYLYGDLRTGIASGRNAAGRTDNFATRLNLDADLKLTDSERLHAFVGPLDDGGAFTRYEYEAGDLRFRNEIDFTPVTAFFEGDLGAIYGGATGQPSPREIPIALGLVPLIFQNGIWIEDAVAGVATSIPAQHSTALNWSNYDATFFAIFDQLNSPAFGADEHAAQAFGTAWFIEAYGGYIESGYAYVRDRNRRERSYHNITASFTRRYFDRISNSVRVIVNTGQDGPQSSRTADGTLLLIENSWITADPLRFVPYFNLFVGWDSPQSVARAGVSGGILRNTGLNFDTDGLNGFSTLDPTANNTAGFSVGVDLIGDKIDRQWILEATYLTRNNGPNAQVQGDQYGLGTRYQFPISHRTLIRTDLMYGWRGGLEDVYGTRMEWRWKF